MRITTGALLLCVVLSLAGCKGSQSPTGPPDTGGTGGGGEDEMRGFGFAVSGTTLNITADHAADGPDQVCGFVNGGDGNYCVPVQGTQFTWVGAGAPYPKVGTLLAVTSDGHQYFANTSAWYLDSQQARLWNNGQAIEVILPGVEACTSAIVQLYGGP